jgi:hypothetical protein
MFERTNLVKNAVSAVIGSGTTSEGGFHIVNSVMLCADVDGGSEESRQSDSGGPIADPESTRLEGLDRCNDLRAVE